MKREDLNFLLQKVEREKVEKIYKKIEENLSVQILSQPTSQTLLVPIKDPVSNGEFYIGEVLVTSCIVEVNQTKGWAMVQDDNKQLSLHVATIDAAFEHENFKKEIEELCAMATVTIQSDRAQLNKKVNSTRVNFDLM